MGINKDIHIAIVGAGKQAGKRITPLMWTMDD